MFERTRIKLRVDRALDDFDILSDIGQRDRLDPNAFSDALIGAIAHVARVDVGRWVGDEPVPNRGTQGSGWLWGRNVLITAAHVIDCRDEGEVATDAERAAQARSLVASFDGGPRLGRELYFYSPPDAWDLAMVLLEPMDREPSPLAISGAPIVAEPICMLHFPRGKFDLSIVDSRVAGTGGIEFYHTCDPDEGSSGAPVFDLRFRVRGLHAGYKVIDRSRPDLAAFVKKYDGKDVINYGRTLTGLERIFEAAYGL